MRRPLLLLVLLALPLTAAAQQHWTGTWAASPYAAPTPAAPADQTIREIVRVSLGGTQVRVTLTNEFGTTPLTIASANIALRASTADATIAAPVSLTFGGRAQVTIPAGAAVLSDAAALALPAFADIVISLDIPAQPIAVITQHSSAYQTSYTVAGLHAADPALPAAKEFYSWRFLKDVEVLAPAAAAAIVTLGDSITDGAQSTRNANARWPNILALRLAAPSATLPRSILNQGIGGNRLLHDITGPGALARFDRDVLAQPGARFVVLLEGINDISHANPTNKVYDPITAADLLFAMRQLIDRAHAHGLKIIGATLTPFGGSGAYSPAGEAMRQAENAFIRSGAFDAFLDFDAATHDPAHPTQFLPLYDSGDHLHPNDAGYKSMADSIDLKIFQK